MSLKNYITTTTDLKGFVPELDLYLWTGDTDYSKERLQAESIVRADFANRGYQLRNLRPELYLETALPDGQYEDVGNRFRAVCVCSTVTGTPSITVSGTNDITDSYTTAGTFTPLVAGTNTFILTDYFKYYKYVITGTATVSIVYLVESDSYDILFKLQWLYIILMDKVVQENDLFHLRAKDIYARYQSLMTSFKPFYDVDEDGDLTESEQQSSNIITNLH